MSGPTPWWRNSLVAMLVAVPAGVASGFAVDALQRSEHAEARAAYEDWEPPPPPPVPEQLEGLLDDLAEDRVIVAHDVADLIAPEQLEEARTTLRRATVPSYLAFVRDPQQGAHGYREDGVLRLMEEAVEGPAYLVVLNSRGALHERSVEMDWHYLDPEVGAGQPGKALVAVARRQVMDPPDPLDEIPEVDPHDYWGGPSGGVMAGGLIGGLVILPVAAVADQLWRRRLPQPKTSKKRKGKVLP